MQAAEEILPELGLPLDDERHAPSEHRFDSGGAWRIEIPSVEGPEALAAVIDAAGREGVPLHRVSQGSGIMMLTDAELADMARLGREANLEVCLSVGPRAGWSAAGASRTPEGGQYGWRLLGMTELRHGLMDVVRATRAGIRSVLIADEGLLQLVGCARAAGQLPSDLVVKAGAALGIANPIQARCIAQLGADTLNISSEISLARLSTMRRVVAVPLDLYVEAPDGLGGFVRYHELADIVGAAAPVYLKFGLRNAPAMYPAGGHLSALMTASSRERVRRALVGVEHLSRLGLSHLMDPPGADRPGLPQAPAMVQP